MAEDDNITIQDSEQRVRERARPKPDMLEAVNKGELKITKINAPLIARKLQEQQLSDKVNQNNISDRDKRNDFIAEQLKEFGIDIKSQTKETEEKVNNSPTQSIATPEKAKQEDPLKSINPINMQKINKEISRLRELQQSAPEYADAFAEMLEKELAAKGKEGFGLSETQINAVKSRNKDLFAKEKNADLSKSDGRKSHQVKKEEQDTKENGNKTNQEETINKYLRDKKLRDLAK